MSTASTSADLRELNLSRALTLVHESSGSLTRVELAESLDVTRTTAAALVNDLAGLNLISETEADPTGRRGRPTTNIRPNDQAPAVLAVEVGLELLSIAELSIGGELRAREDIVLRSPDPAHALEQIGAELTKRRASLGRMCAGIGMAVHGLVDEHSGTVVQAPHLGWKKVELGNVIRDSQQIPVIVGNDATFGAIVEAKHGAGKDSRTMLYLRSTVGVGGGFTSDGNVTASRRGWHGEIGHLPFGDPISKCRCGAYGCWELGVNQAALAEAAGHEVSATNASELATRVFVDAGDGDPRSIKAIESVCAVLGRGLGSLINAFDPEVIVLAGHVQNLHEANPAATMAALERATMAAHRGSLPPVLSGAFHDPALRGAGEVILSELIASPSMLLAP